MTAAAAHPGTECRTTPEQSAGVRPADRPPTRTDRRMTTVPDQLDARDAVARLRDAGLGPLLDQLGDGRNYTATGRPNLRRVARRLHVPAATVYRMLDRCRRLLPDRDRGSIAEASRDARPCPTPHTRDSP